MTDAVLGGWQISNIVTTRPGLPINVTLAASGVDPATNKSYSVFGRNGGSLRPNRVGLANSGIDPKTDRLRFLSSSAFAVQTLNTPGNSSRNVAWGPKLFKANISLVKRFAVNDHSSFDVLFEGFNAFNNVNFSNPNTTFGGSTFGNITSAGESRVIQAAIRYRF